ncbi:type VII secretion protein EccE [Phytomonospora sp. NPDC050363]|uniref:type VII secretion protein EccE n=1 Tax=Phytomonospora sp. NPDC050363 TaxID=3155642 RepID=UPI0033F193A3
MASTSQSPVRVGVFTAAQLIVLELACAGVLLASALPREWFIASAAVAVLILAVTFGRGGGRWWYSSVTVWQRLRSRRRVDGRMAAAAEPTTVAPDGVADFGPRPRLATITERGGDLGVAFDGSGWYSAMAVETAEAQAAVFEVLAGVLSHSGAPVSSLQMLTQTVPAPSTGLDHDVLCAQSYRELLDGHQTVAHRESWCVVRLDVRDAAPVAAGRGGGERGVHRALTSAVSRLTKGGEGLGVRLRPLGEAELARSLRQSIGGETVAAAVADDVAEHWDTWRTGTLSQVTYALHGRVAEPLLIRRLWTSVTELPADFTTVSVNMRRLSERRGDHRLNVQCLVRLAADEEQIEELCARLVELARMYRVRLRRCDGEQGPAVYASALTGSGW